MATQANNKNLFQLQLFAVGVGVFILASKFAAYLFTHSNSILTDALESVINVVAGSFALYSLYLSSKPKDIDHPYGHGKVEFISAGFEGILIILAGVLIIGKSIFSFFEPRPLEHLDWGLVIIVSSGVINFVIGYYLESEGEKQGSLTLKADGQHLKSDAYSSVGILVGIGLILVTRWYFLDNVVAIIFGCVIIYTGVRLLRKSIAGIMDEADATTTNAIINLLNTSRRPEWIDVHNLRIVQYGNKLHIDCHVTLPWYFTLEEAHKHVEEMAKVVNEMYALQVEFSIHEDPCLPPKNCRICEVTDCPVRQDAFKGRVEWALDNVVKNQRHSISE